MMRSYRYLHLDVFTDRLFGGNQLAVFLDARGLASDTMQSIANEINYSETVFVLPAETPATDVRLRIFTPREELPMAGHPAIGAAFALARVGRIAPGKDRLIFALGTGPTPMSLIWRNEELGFVWMMQAAPSFGDPIADPGGVAAALRLSATAVTGTGLPVQIVSCGVPFLFVPLATRRAVDSATLDELAYDSFRNVAGLEELPICLFTTDSHGDAAHKATTYSRVFAPVFGIVEDAATGGASGALGCYLVRHKVVTTEKAGGMLNVQGVRMGRPSHVHMAIGVEDGDIVSVRVGGESVIAGDGLLYV
jgi:trans-2,3-dihydro-3-hydroxyanthranilate isomerase